MAAVTFPADVRLPSTRDAFTCDGEREGTTARYQANRRATVSHVSDLIPQALARCLAGTQTNWSDPHLSIKASINDSIKEDEMLLLSRKTAETIVINDSVVVKVVRISGGRVAIGIEAPAEVSIRRGELGVRNPAPLECGDSSPLWISNPVAN
jgi:carbon storage regulator CsrA